MTALTVILAVHAVSTLALTGLIWFVQVVHYPLMGAVPPTHFVHYERQHTRRTTWVVAPLMLAEAFTAATLLALDLEQRWMIYGPLEGVLFASPVVVGRVDDLGSPSVHPAGGAGVRFLLPPEELNVIRLDVAISDSGWGVYAGWGETF